MFINPNIISTSVKKRFVKDFSLPINLFKEPYFSYFLNEFNNFYKIDEKINYLNTIFNDIDSENQFFDLSEKLVDSIKKEILNTNSYKNFNEKSIGEIIPNEDELGKLNVINQELYIDENINKFYLSVDLSNANYNVINLFGLNDELKVKSYQNLLSKNTNYDYFIKSKYIRQVILGQLNPSRQQKIQKKVLLHFIKTLKDNSINNRITISSNDEFIIHLNKNDNIDNLQIKINSILLTLDNKFHFFKVEKSTFQKIDENHKFLIKKTFDLNNNEKIDFKNVPTLFFPQVYKKYFNLEVNDYDLTFFHEGFKAKLEEKLFDNSLVKKNKI